MTSRNYTNICKYEEMRLLYLLSGSRDVLPPSYAKLRSYLNFHIANLVDKQNLSVLKSITDRNRTCPYCYSAWSGDTTSLKLLPSKRYRTPKAYNGTTENEKGEIHKLNESRNTLVLKCKVCTKKSLFSLVKLKPIEEEVKEDTVVPVKKKKKKKDKSCGLAVNLIKHEENLTQIINLKKKNRMKNKEKAKVANPAHAQGVLSTESPKNIPVPKTTVNVKTKNIAPNPFATQIQKGLSKKNAKKLEKLKQAVKGEKNLVKKTLQDFLTLV